MQSESLAARRHQVIGFLRLQLTRRPQVRLGHFEAAARALNAAVELRPSCIEYIHERAKALQMCGASALPPVRNCNTLRRYGRHSDAILDFTTVLAARPRLANASDIAMTAWAGSMCACVSEDFSEVAPVVCVGFTIDAQQNEALP